MKATSCGPSAQYCLRCFHSMQPGIKSTVADGNYIGLYSTCNLHRKISSDLVVHKHSLNLSNAISIPPYHSYYQNPKITASQPITTRLSLSSNTLAIYSIHQNFHKHASSTPLSILTRSFSLSQKLSCPL